MQYRGLSLFVAAMAVMLAVGGVEAAPWDVLGSIKDKFSDMKGETQAFLNQDHKTMIPEGKSGIEFCPISEDTKNPKWESRQCGPKENPFSQYIIGEKYRHSGDSVFDGNGLNCVDRKDKEGRPFSSGASVNIRGSMCCIIYKTHGCTLGGKPKNEAVRGIHGKDDAGDVKVFDLKDAWVNAAASMLCWNTPTEKTKMCESWATNKEGGDRPSAEWVANYLK
ncbi:hypothetical protein EX30DRAFT_1941 [Ascodesmis nigricans]|uniref:Ecp2 effector protein domain-containing protein n=1 Tax=Ascodesmis nigricans TaxID=341454 RepID=A0A4S2N5H3_9PEZI|nr:hypothetical protein EX30DRAFT_1941 [Ascodesmis nigricans]